MSTLSPPSPSYPPDPLNGLKGSTPGCIIFSYSHKIKHLRKQNRVVMVVTFQLQSQASMTRLPQGCFSALWQPCGNLVISKCDGDIMCRYTLHYFSVSSMLLMETYTVQTSPLSFQPVPALQIVHHLSRG